MTQQRNIVVLGASYAGLGAAHYTLKHVIPQLPSEPDISYKLVLVNPSSRFYARHASPRAIASEKLMPYDKIFVPIEPGFGIYGSTFRFVQGKAVEWDPEDRAVTIETVERNTEVIKYHALVLATGSKTYSPLFSSRDGEYTDVKQALDALHSKLAEEPTRIVITGGGPTAVETAGELGEALNGSAGWFSSQPAPRAKITLITNADNLLPQLRPAIGKQAELFLNRLRVEVRYQTKVSSCRETADGKTRATLHDGEELEADIYIPAIGVQPMSAYVPSNLKDSRGYVKQNHQTLRVNEAGPLVYALGDVGTYSRNSIMDILNSVGVLGVNMKRDLLAAHHDLHAKPQGKDKHYEPNMKETLIVPVGRNKGKQIEDGTACLLGLTRLRCRCRLWLESTEHLCMVN
jgi:apoptosis-inducing factor 2